MPQKGQAKLTIDQVIEGIDKYFKECDNSKADMVAGKTLVEVRKPYTVEGMAVSLGISKQTLCEWRTGTHVHDITPSQIEEATTADGRRRLTEAAEANKKQYGTYTPVADALSRASDKIGRDIAERALLNTYNPKIACLILSQFGYIPETTSKVDATLNVRWQGVEAGKLDDYSG